MVASDQGDNTELPGDLHAAIDIGTNSVHLVVARALPGGGFDVVTAEKEVVRLGSGGGTMTELQPDAIQRGLDAVGRMVAVANSLGADVRAVATSAVREAENRNQFLDPLRRDLGIEVEVISGLEEARLIHHGVIHALPVVAQRILVVDIGGGSTELIVGEGVELIEARSLRLGAIRLTERFFGGGLGPAKPNSQSVKASRDYLRNALKSVARDLGGHSPQLAVGSSGTITTAAMIVAGVRGAEARHMNGFSFTADELDEAVAVVLGASASERLHIDGLDEKRVDIIIGGIILLDEIFRAFELESMTISEFALREGVLFDRFPAGEAHLYNLRRSNALRLARQLDPDPDHSIATARLALQLFDRTTDVHRLGAQARELLDVAALVHNVGLFISHSGYHRHTYYVVRHSEQLTGFTDREVELVAQIARYHRKGLPSPSQAPFGALDDDDQRLVAILAGLLRLAVGLDRRHASLVRAVRVYVDPDEIAIEPVVDPGTDVGLEVFAANERADLLAQVLGRPVVVREATRSDLDVDSA